MRQPMPMNAGLAGVLIFRSVWGHWWFFRLENIFRKK